MMSKLPFLLVGLFLTTAVGAKAEPELSREAGIIMTSKAEIARREKWPLGAQFSVAPDSNGGWRVTASRIRSSKNGRAQLGKERRTIVFDVDGNMTKYSPAK